MWIPSFLLSLQRAILSFSMCLQRRFHPSKYSVSFWVCIIIHTPPGAGYTHRCSGGRRSLSKIPFMRKLLHCSVDVWFLWPGKCFEKPLWSSALVRGVHFTSTWSWAWFFNQILNHLVLWDQTLLTDKRRPTYSQCHQHCTTTLLWALFLFSDLWCQF